MAGLEPDIRRIRTELRSIWVDPPAFCRPGASPVTDILHWEVVIDGPDGTPYAGGTFPVDIDFDGNYPLTHPKITFKTKIFHPCIEPEGEMTLRIFDEWSPATTVQLLLIYIVALLDDPMLDGQRVNAEVSDVYESDAKLYEEMARAWTWEYSSAPIVSYYPTAAELDRCASAAAEERLRRCNEEREMVRQRAAALSSAARATWNRVAALLQGCSVGVPFATSRKRFSSTLLPLSNYTGRACL